MPRRRPHLSLDDYDCIGFDLDHTLCRYNVGAIVRLEYEVLADFLINKKGYDPAIKQRRFDDDLALLAKGLTLDCERGNLLRLGCDGAILAAFHGTRRLGDHEIEKLYGRCRRKHPGSDYTQHLSEYGPQKMVDFGPLLHNFMDYFDMAAPLLCARLVDVIDAINNHGRPMEEYFFWPDVQEGLREMFMRTHFAANTGGFFPAIKQNPEQYILKRRPEFREWLKMLRENGKFLYVITGSHFDFASHVAGYALGEDWKDLFDIVVFFARKPSFFVEKRPFWRLDGPNEVESFKGWEDLETGEYYSQGNWQDLNEFFEYCTEWEPSTSLYFGDNVLQDVLAPKKFTTTIDSVAVSEELMAEGMVGHDPSHPDKDLLASSQWGSYFFCAREPRNKQVAAAATSFRKMSSSTNPTANTATAQNEDMKRALSLRRVSSMRTPADIMEAAAAMASAGAVAATVAVSATIQVASSTPQTPRATPVPSGASSENSVDSTEEQQVPNGPQKINTLWGTLIRDYARMCIPDIDVLVDYPVDYRFPAFARDKQGNLTGSGFFPADPASLHPPPPAPPTVPKTKTKS